MTKYKLTVGTAVYDDFDGAYFTMTSMMIHQRSRELGVQLLTIDNNPTSARGRKLQAWMQGRAKHHKYVPYTEFTGTAQPRNEIFRQADGEYVLAIDCHVLLLPGMLEKLIAYYDDNPDTRDLLSGPMLNDDGSVAATHQRPEWGAGAYGKWSIDETKAKYRDSDGKMRTVRIDDDPNGFFESEPFEIWQQGMGLFSCKREHWVEFHPRFRGFGGCETYIMEKTRRRGGRVMCCPFLAWTHRFARPDGVPYRASQRDKLRNYAIGFTELGLPLDDVLDHFKTSIGLVERLMSQEEATPDPPAKTSERIAVKPKGPPNPARRVQRRESAPRARPTVPRTKKRSQDDGSDDYAVIGARQYGGTKMRGRPLAESLGCKLLDPRSLGGMNSRRTIIYVKDGCCPSMTRRKARERLVYDPLDVFASGRSNVDPSTYWAHRHRELMFDDIIATSPACLEVMRRGIPKHVRVHLVPHQCDGAIDPSWRDDSGHVAYAGLGRFVESKLDHIQRACDKLGRKFVRTIDKTALRGACCALALRLPPYDTPLNRYCKPQIKLENAAAANLPAVATNDPASTSVCPGIVTVESDFTVDQLARAIDEAMSYDGLSDPYTTDDYLKDMRKLLGVAENERTAA